jgi:hypothetical protein
VPEKATSYLSFEKITDVLIWVYLVIATAAYKFFKWFAVREYQNFISDMNSRIQNELHRMNGRLDSIESQFHSYKKIKHDIDNENAALTGSMLLCKEALDVASKVIEKSNKYAKERKINSADSEVS